MASFTDAITSFNPYIQQIPVDDYVRVGMQKQQDYEMGVAKVQNYIDNISGLEVVKGEHKEYLNKTLEGLQGNISKVVSADFANNQLVNQIGSLTNRIAKDPILENAVLSTQRYKQGLTEMQKARQEGKSSVENEWFYQRQAQAWLSDQDATSSFNGAYVPYKDVRKKIMDTIKQIDPSSKITQLPFRRNADGSTALDANGNPEIDIAMLEVSEEGKSVETIRRAVELALDHTDLQQLQIEGQYHFRNYDPVAMKSVVDSNYKARVERLNDYLDDLATKKKMNIKDNAYQANIDNQIKAIRERGEGLSKAYQRDIGLLSASPEDFKSKFYSENYMDQIADTFSTSKTSVRYLANPYQAQVNENRNFNLNYEKFIHEKAMDFKNLDLSERKFEFEQKEAKSKQKALETAGLLPAMIPLGLPTGDIEKENATSWQEGIRQQDAQLAALKDKALTTLFDKLPKAKAEVELEKLRQAWEAGKTGDMDPNAARYFAETEALTQQVQNKKAALMAINAELDKNPDLKLNPNEKIGLRVGNTDYSTNELLSYNEKVNKVTYAAPSSGTGMAIGKRTMDEKEARKIMTDKEFELFKVQKKKFDGERLSTGEKAIMDGLQKVGNLPEKIQKIAAKREELIASRLTSLVNEFRPEAYTIDAGKGETRYMAKGMVGPIIEEANQRGGVGKSPNFDYDEAKKAINSDGTVFGIYKQGNEAFITLSAGEKTKTQYIPVTPQQLAEIAPNGFNRPFDPIKNAIQLSGGISTNVQRKGHSTSFFKKTDFPAISEYGVKGDIEPGITGGYQMRLYIHNPTTKNWEERVLPKSYSDEGEILADMKIMGNRTIKELLEQKPK